MKHYTLLILTLLLSTACVSKKKHLAAVAQYESQRDSLAFELDSTIALIGELRLDTAEMRGANTALLLSQDKLHDRLIALDDEIERLQAEAAQEAESLDERIQQKNALIAEREATISSIRQVLDAQSEALSELAVALRDSLLPVDSTAFTIEAEQGGLSLSVASDFLFYPGSTFKLQEEGVLAMQKTAALLQPYPFLDVIIIGHTNNEPLRRKSIDSKWEFTAMRAASLAQLMSRSFNLSTSRIMAAGKGEYAPRASNTTEEGRALNDRMQILIRPSEERLLRDLRRQLDKN